MSAPDDGVHQHHPAHLRRIVHASRLFAEAVPDCQRLLTLIAEYVHEVTGDACTVRLLSEDGTQLRPAAAYHPDGHVREAMWQMMAETSQRTDVGLWRTVIDDRRPITVALSGEIPPEASHAPVGFMQRSPLCGIVVAPLIARDRVLGAISQVRDGNGSSMTSDDEDLLALLAERAALAIENAHLYETTRSQIESWRALVDNAPDIISRFDRELRHLYVNPAVESAAGLPASAMIGKSNRELGMLEPLVATWELALQQVFRDGQERRLEFSFPTPSGERHYQTRLAPEHGPDGSVQTVLTIARDITDQKKADLQRDELYRELLERDRRLHDLVSRVLFERDSILPHEALGAEMVSTTPRERAILRLMAVGKTNQQIGLELGLSAGTVKNHVARVIEKLAVPDRTAAAVRAVQLGLIKLG